MVKRNNMKWEYLKEILEEEYPLEGAIAEDIIGELTPIPKNIDTIISTLDITLDVIYQAKKCNAKLIISHHPLWWGDKEEEFEKDSLLKSMYDLLIEQEIGLYVIHTNADYASNSLAYLQALAINLEKIEQNDGNLSVTGYLKEETTVLDLSNIFKTNLELGEVEFRSNLGPNEMVKKITISTGASGSYGINSNDHESLFILGEVKHHEWVKARQLNLKVLELSHFSEIIFKHMIKVLLDKEEVEVIISEEKNGYKII